MRTIILSIGLVFMLAFSIGCDSDNNVVAQDEEPGPGSPPSGMTTVNGTIIAPGDQCDGALEGFDVGDSITVQMLNGNEPTLPSGKVENNTKMTSVDCGGNGVITDDLPFSGMVCSSENSSIPGFTNGNLMSMLVSFTWVDEFINNIPNTVIIIAEDISFVMDMDPKNVPCARVKIDNLTASN
ncbi:MAG: hypothetical protein E2O70_00375 [Candidatus Dadabacteria bacterium]|nr:MAG: hypothetical protein E2O70_00375 [Candidatus Dadabacteria bacterium]